MKIFFASSSNFGEIALNRMINNGIKPSVLITAPDKRSERGQKIKQLPIKSFAQKNKIKVKEAEKKEDFHKIILKERPDLVIVAGFKIIIPEETIKISEFINIHPSLLPKYRGATPIQTTIIDGVKTSGTTIIKMNEKMDQGPIIAQREAFLEESINYKDVEERLAKVGGDLVSEKAIPFLNGEIAPREQDENQATYTKMLKKDDGRINWKESAEIIEKKVRALNPWPSTYSTINGKIIKILKAEIQKQTGICPVGDPGKTYLGTNHSIAVQTGKDFILIKKLQIEGKKPTTAEDFIKGNINLIGSTLL